MTTPSIAITCAAIAAGLGAISYRKTIQNWAFSWLWKRMSQSTANRVKGIRAPLWSSIRGKVLEVGVGHGDTLFLLPEGLKGITEYVAMEPNQFLHEKLAENAERAGFFVVYDPDTCPSSAKNNKENDTKKPVLTIVKGTFDDPSNIPKFVSDQAPFDVVAISFALCSVDNPQANLQVAQSLLAPGGQYVFIEHVRHTDESDATVASDYTPGMLNLSAWKVVQDYLTPLWRCIFGNCALDRQTNKMIMDMPGWEKINIKTRREVNGFMAKLTPMVYGIATKASD
ncbi:hypothetical protein GGF46_003437 [Coemansia sp. RSA 552]|nr:hypothetical protein GGF46_003437 [Coemansia sp. RSA 552]